MTELGGFCVREIMFAGVFSTEHTKDMKGSDNGEGI